MLEEGSDETTQINILSKKKREGRIGRRGE